MGRAGFSAGSRRGGGDVSLNWKQLGKRADTDGDTNLNKVWALREVRFAKLWDSGNTNLGCRVLGRRVQISIDPCHLCSLTEIRDQ